MGFDKFIQLGRICLVNRGRNAGKLVIIVDFVDQNRVLVDGPCTGVRRQMMNMKSLSITKFVITIHNLMKSATLAKVWEREGVTAKWEATIWAKHLAAKAKRASMNDFDRYKLMRARQTRSRIEAKLSKEVEAVFNERRQAKAAIFKALKARAAEKKAKA